MIAVTRRWSISTRLFVLQVVFIVVLTGVALVWLWNDARGMVEQNAADHSLSVATSIADNPFVVEAVSARASAAPSVVLQPYAQNLSADTDTDFITIMAPDRTRYTHPNPAEIGRAFVGNIQPALDGQAFTETYTGTLGPSVRSVVPIRDAGGSIVALVAAGVTVSNVSVALGERLPFVFGFAALTLLFGALASWLLSRYLRRVTWGQGPEQMSRMFLYYEGVLHSVREGLLLVDPRGRLVLQNDQATELLGLAPRVDGAPELAPVAVASLAIPDALRDLLASGNRAVDEIFVTDTRVLVVNQEPAVAPGSVRVMGTVTTLRDHTDLLRISGELQNMRTLSDALRSQTHEYANRLHTIVALIELGRPEEAIALAAGELDRGQELADQLVEAVDEPVLAALLVGKSAQARERGVTLELSVDPSLGAIGVPADDLITIVGNLVDNALDAVSATPGSASQRESTEEGTRIRSSEPDEAAVDARMGVGALRVGAREVGAREVGALRVGAGRVGSGVGGGASGPPRVAVLVSGRGGDGAGGGGAGTGGGGAGGDQRELVIRVSDNGPGIDDVARAFERGYSSKAAGPEGRGFGLALVGQSVRRLGGTIDVTSEGGAVVTVVLPRSVRDRVAPGGEGRGAMTSGPA